jgi:hypothetical protein
MATVTPNFNWPVPTSTDLVKDGATAIEALGDSIDASLVDLKGGTTGQVLSKTSGTDMDFTWVTTDDANAIQNSIVDAKGDLISATANDTPARLAVGANGETLVADSSTSTGLRYTGNYAAGKNKIINGDFGIWQRGTSFTSIANLSYTADRFYEAHDGTGTVNVTRQAFTPGTAPVAGYEGSYFYRQAVTSAGTTTFFQTAQKIEDVTTFAGQTVKVSFWAKADSARTGLVYGDQFFGTGGSSQVQLDVNYFSLTTSWQRFSFTYSIPSIAGKTIGTGSSLAFYFRNGGTVSGATIDLWGIQVEPGSVATAFQTATGTIQGELAAAQRYYYRATPASNYSNLALGHAISTTGAMLQTKLPTTMRTRPTAIEYGGTIQIFDGVTATNITTLQINQDLVTTTDIANIRANVSSGLTQYRPYQLSTVTDATAYIGFSAEL